MPWHRIMPLPISCLLALIVGELTVHGYDLAQAGGARWRIPDEWAYTTFVGVLPVVPLAVDAANAAGVSSCYDIRIRGAGGPRVVFRFSDSVLTMHQPGTVGPIDCYLSGDPLSLLLVLYGRTSPWGPALTGKALAWGRKPWRGLTMTKLFRPV